MNLISVLTKFLNVGIHPNLDADICRQIFIINVFALVGISVSFIMGSNAIVKGNHLLATILFSTCATFYLSHLVLHLTKITNVYKLSSNLLLICLMSLMVYLVCSGGADNTGALWIYIVPPVALFFGGVRRGIINICIFLLIIGVLIFYPDNKLLVAYYTFAFKIRLLLSFVTVTFLFAFYEYFRQKSYREIRELSDKFEQQAHQDPLTGLVNRRGMREKLVYEQGRAKRSKTHMSLLMCDVDHFKKINDDFCHDAGDLVLKSLSNIFTSTIRQQDIAARWGGEEFLFLLPETTALEAYTLAEKIRKHVEAHSFTYQGREIKVTLCFGVSEVSDEEHIDHAINQADHYLYQAKKSGRNRVLPTP